MCIHVCVCVKENSGREGARLPIVYFPFCTPQNVNKHLFDCQEGLQMNDYLLMELVYILLSHGEVHNSVELWIDHRQFYGSRFFSFFFFFGQQNIQKMLPEIALKIFGFG